MVNGVFSGGEEIEEGYRTWAKRKKESLCSFGEIIRGLDSRSGSSPILSKNSIGQEQRRTLAIKNGIFVAKLSVCLCISQLLSSG